MGPDYPGSRRIISEALRLVKVPEQSLDICISSITTSTLKQYDVGLKLWWFFCTNLERDPFKFSVPLVLDFLTIQFKKGASYGSLNSFRSAIAQIFGPQLGQDPRIKRFFKGVYSLRPTSAKYTHTWDPSIVLDYVKNLDNDKITLDLLTKKLCVLLALATAQRVQTLSKIEISNIQRNDKFIEIKISDRVKTSAINRFQPILILPFYPADSRICPATALLIYLERTKTLRGNATHLLITYKKPYHEASPQTISRWLKSILTTCGLDTNKFTAHSTRHAATSAAARKGVNIDRIRLTAGWTEKSKMFATVYNRPLSHHNNFGEKILEN